MTSLVMKNTLPKVVRQSPSLTGEQASIGNGDNG